MDSTSDNDNDEQILHFFSKRNPFRLLPNRIHLNESEENKRAGSDQEKRGQQTDSQTDWETIWREGEILFDHIGANQVKPYTKQQ